MINVKELRISEDNRLIVTAEVLEIPTDPQRSFHFAKAVVMFSSGGEYDSPLPDGGDGITSVAPDGRKLQIIMPIDATPFDHKNDIIKVSLWVEGDAAAERDTTCNTFSRAYEGYAYKKCLVSDYVLSYMSKDECADIYNIASAVARAYALESAIEVRDWETIKRYWNSFFKRSHSGQITNCGCHGR